MPVSCQANCRGLVQLKELESESPVTSLLQLQSGLYSFLKKITMLPIVTNVKCLFDMKPLPIKMSQKYDSFTEDSFLSAEHFSAHHLGQIQM